MRLRAFSSALFLCALVAPALQAQSPAPFTDPTHRVLPLWPHVAPEPGETTGPEALFTFGNGKAANGIANVSVATMTLYPVPAGVTPTGAGILVFPGGGYQHLAWVGEGQHVCDFFNANGLFCAIVRYRIPWKERFPATYGPLEDAQQAMRIARAHASEWGFDPKRLGALGFSAGGHLMATLSNHFDDPHVLSTPAAPDVDAKISPRPDFVMLGYPAYLPVPPDNRTLDPNQMPNKDTPPTFMMQAENDKLYVDSSLVYVRALKDAGVPEEFILFPDGGHGFGIDPAGKSPAHWGELAIDWLHTIKILK